MYREHVSSGTNKEPRDRSIKKPEREWRLQKHVGEVEESEARLGTCEGAVTSDYRGMK